MKGELKRYLDFEENFSNKKFNILTHIKRYYDEIKKDVGDVVYLVSVCVIY